MQPCHPTSFQQIEPALDAGEGHNQIVHYLRNGKRGPGICLDSRTTNRTLANASVTSSNFLTCDGPPDSRPRNHFEWGNRRKGNGPLPIEAAERGLFSNHYSHQPRGLAAGWGNGIAKLRCLLIALS
jgi:hypothetical protein